MCVERAAPAKPPVDAYVMLRESKKILGSISTDPTNICHPKLDMPNNPEMSTAQQKLQDRAVYDAFSLLWNSNVHSKQKDEEHS